MPRGHETSTLTDRNRIALFIPTFGDGGVEHMLVNLARGFASHGREVDFLVKHGNAPYLSTLGRRVNLIELQSANSVELLSALLRYLNRFRPQVLMSAKAKDDRLAIQAKCLAEAPPRVFLRTGTHISARLAVRRRNPLKRWLTHHAIRRLCARADGVICVSQGVADDLARISKLPRKNIQVLRNPVVTPEMLALASAPAEHPWLTPNQPPVILGAGGLRRQKNFTLLIQAFARVHSQHPCRLIILGEGRQRRRLQKLARKLDVAEAVSLPGFVANPYAYMAKAALFVLSSYWEGSPNVVVESLAVGTPVVATDCPSGPREILQNGRYGTLVPVGEAEALGEAILATLKASPDPDRLRAAAQDYTLESSSAAYLKAFGML